MPKNNGKARKAWRRKRAEMLHKPLTFEERLILAIFGDPEQIDYADDAKPDTELSR